MNLTHSPKTIKSLPDEFLIELDIKSHRSGIETDAHLWSMINLLHALQEFFRHDSTVYAAGNRILCYRDETNLWQSISPDIMVIFGVEKK